MVGISLSATVIQQTLRSTLRERLTSGEDVERIMEGVRQSLDYLKLLKPETREIVKGCYEVATRNGFGILLGIPCLALLSSCMYTVHQNARDEANPWRLPSFHQRENTQQAVAAFWALPLSIYSLPPVLVFIPD